MRPSEDKLQQVATAVQNQVSTRLRDVWWSFLLRGLLAWLMAACALFWPQATVEVLVALLGIYFLIDGVASVVAALRAEKKGLLPMQAIISLVGGTALLFWPDVSAKLFLVLVGGWTILQGIGMWFSSRSLDPQDENRSLVAIVGAVIAVLGLVVMLWPSTGIVAISWLIAVGAMLVGGLFVYLATRLQRVRKRLSLLAKS